ncbi:hypothetical protein OG884_17420 [Streptosporangium sp. NBC_01755]|uniref:hypothetical protein n=1 Tax=Streptosporangium sp. NBC_01755 TaxID=2975949 RepID=UPI002DD88978|nr:hypothetical protein [Streptosporangium sp. NBC_01755]WSD03590.1 hypothetical protein OG884_17420 [Streptosporangium sp. NBC_01755]
MSQPEYIAGAIPGFDVWRDDSEADVWRGRHRQSGRTISADNWELLVWRAYEVRILISITNITEALDGHAGS